jgi:creatinine amidohydrolase
MRPYVLAETNWKTVREIDYQLAVLPWGATEAHNYHLPFATDTIQCDFIAAEASRQAWERGARVVVLPTVPFGVNTQQLDIKLVINMNPSTQLLVLRDVVHSLAEQRIPRLVILNGHGGNDFRQMIRELQPQFPDVFLCAVNWYQVGEWNDFFEEAGDHAGEMETSLMMHIVPDLVLPLSEAGDGTARPFAVPGLRERWAWAPRHWTRVTDDTGVGDPRHATAEKGAAYLTYLTRHIGQFLADLAAADPQSLYADTVAAHL